MCHTKQRWARGKGSSLAREHAARGRWRIGSANGTPQDVVHFVVVVEVFFSEIETGGARGGGRIGRVAIFERNARLLGLIRRQRRLRSESGEHGPSARVEVGHGM